MESTRADGAVEKTCNGVADEWSQLVEQRNHPCTMENRGVGVEYTLATEWTSGAIVWWSNGADKLARSVVE